VRGCKRPCIPP